MTVHKYRDAKTTVPINGCEVNYPDGYHAMAFVWWAIVCNDSHRPKMSMSWGGCHIDADSKRVSLQGVSVISHSKHLTSLPLITIDCHKWTLASPKAYLSIGSMCLQPQALNEADGICCPCPLCWGQGSYGYYHVPSQAYHYLLKASSCLSWLDTGVNKIKPHTDWSILHLFYNYVPLPLRIYHSDLYINSLWDVSLIKEHLNNLVYFAQIQWLRNVSL